MREISNKIVEKMKVKDFISLYDLYIQFDTHLAKAKKIVAEKGVPKFYIRTVILLERLT